MSAVRPSPARIVKRAQVSASLASLLAPGADPNAPLPTAHFERPAAANAQRVAKTARLVPGVLGTAVVEVRCSCGEATHVELRWSENRATEEPR
jgi:hypothetical protein